MSITVTDNLVIVQEVDNVVTVTTSNTAIGAGVTDHGSLTGLTDDDHPQYLTQTEADLLYGSTSLTLATRVAILSTSPAAGSLAFSTDTYEFFVYTGTAWYRASTAFVFTSLTGLNFSIASNSQYIPMVN